MVSISRNYYDFCNELVPQEGIELLYQTTSIGLRNNRARQHALIFKRFLADGISQMSSRLIPFKCRGWTERGTMEWFE